MIYEVLLADDHAIIRDGLKNILAETDEFRVMGEAGDGNTVMELVRQRNWDLLVLDISMPGRSGVELIKLVKQERPSLPILVFSMHLEEQYAVRAIRSGASGYLSKGGDSDEILPAMRKVAQGGRYISSAVAELLLDDVTFDADKLPHKRLSDREFEIFSQLVNGLGPTQIADQLSLSVKTVSTHKSRILQKMGMDSTVDLVRYAMEHRLIDDQP